MKKVTTHLACHIFVFLCVCTLLLTSQTASASELLGQKSIKIHSAQELPRWSAIQQTTLANRFNPSNNQMDGWNSFINSIKNESGLRKMMEANLFINKIAYKQDNWIYGKNDYWASPAEFLKQGGDCEDYAITKYFTLRQLGFSASHMKIAMVYDVYSGTDHAFLIVKFNGVDYVLDNREKLVVARYMKNRYKPHYAFNEDKVWLYNSPVMVKKLRADDGKVMAGNR